MTRSFLIFLGVLLGIVIPAAIVGLVTKEPAITAADRRKIEAHDAFCVKERVRTASLVRWLQGEAREVRANVWQDESIYLRDNAAACLGEHVPWITASCASSSDTACIVKHLEARRDALEKGGW